MNQPGECDAVDGASLHLLPMRSGDTISPAVRPFQLLGRGQVAFSLSVLVWLAAAGGPGVRAQVGDNQPALSSGFLAAQGNASSTRLSAVTPPADAQGLLGLKEPPAGRQAVSLEDCLKRALGEAPDTRIAVERVVQQQAQLRNRQLNDGYSEAMRKVEKAMVDVVAEYAVEKKLELVVTKGVVLYAGKTLDITGEVVKRVNKKLPTVAVEIPK